VRPVETLPPRPQLAAVLPPAAPVAQAVPQVVQQVVQATRAQPLALALPKLLPMSPLASAHSLSVASLLLSSLVSWSCSRVGQLWTWTFGGCHILSNQGGLDAIFIVVVL